MRKPPCRQGDGSRDRIFVTCRGLVKSVNISDDIKRSWFSIVEEGGYKYGNGENWNDPCNVGLELEVLVWYLVFSPCICQIEK